MSSLYKIGKEFLKRFNMLRIQVVFLTRILSGYRLYKNLLWKYGSDTAILGTAWPGNGDYYICAGYLRAWLRKNGISKFIFLTPGGAEDRVLELFPLITGHIVRLNGREEVFSHLLQFCAFLGIDRCQFHNFHHQQSFPAGNLLRGELQGFRGLNMVDFYLICGFGLDADVPKDRPVFSNNEIKIMKWFQDYDLRPGKTVLLAPHSTGLEEFLPPESFWIELVQGLKAAGYCVCTNCVGVEKPVSGTVGLEIPFKEIVPFLNMAGGFIGIRSGLCDVISTSNCRKIILHTYRAKWWPDGQSIPYTGLNNMGLCENAVEMEVTERNQEPVLSYVMAHFI